MVTRNTVEAGQNAVNKGDEMRIDLKQPGALTPDSVRDLLASASDDTDTQLCVTKEGVAFIRSLTAGIGPDNMDGLAFRLETWLKGTGSVGSHVLQHAQWVEQVYRALLDNWPTPMSDVIDMDVYFGSDE